MLCSECGIVTESRAYKYDGIAAQPSEEAAFRLKDTRVCKNSDCENFDRKLMIIEVLKGKDKDEDVDVDIEALYNKELTDEDVQDMCNRNFSDEEIKDLLNKASKGEKEEEDIGDLHIWLDRKPKGMPISEFIENEIEKRRRQKKIH